ncbi:MAG: hypothetical protein QG602_1361 [Verrucomicrobiota bacterium]|nr:hypothetical protein [Verrucomicrobiota bacterium]
MKLRALSVLLLFWLVSSASVSAQTPTQQEIISASCLIAFGRPAELGELNAPLLANKTLAQLVAGHREVLKNDPKFQRLVHLQAYADAYGVPKALDLVTKGLGHERGLTYSEQLNRHLKDLTAAPDEYRVVINRAYQLVIRRDAYPEEVAYWKPFGTLPYVVLVGAIENWAFRNQPGLMVTTGTPSIAVNSRFLRTQRVPLSLANEARDLLGLPVWTDVARQHNPGRNIVAVGAKDIASVGGVHFLLAGGGPLAGM